jgi:hypothetical protein
MFEVKETPESSASVEESSTVASILCAASDEKKLPPSNGSVSLIAVGLLDASSAS